LLCFRKSWSSEWFVTIQRRSTYTYKLRGNL
jgi:hypothetical protein